MNNTILMTFNFDFSTNYILENDTVRLEPLQESHFANLFTESLQNPEIWKYSSLPTIGAENFRKYIQLALNNREKLTEYAFVVLDKRTNEYAGSTRFYDMQLSNKTLQLGYTWYGKQFQGTGLNKHCKYLLLEFAFEKMNVERVEFRADNANETSKAAMKSIGCKVDGILRSNMTKLDGGRRDSIILSILRSEWFDGVKENIRKKLLR
ncbi:GNAT family N-acetyltransferase [Flavobacterium psychrophilum]|uniref:Acetyltransferase, GNAT family n=2 Tax=Flavobacterium psychrophilum TaxID=96345 RepID=A6GXG8_FLAPJ|nr:GNAT family protein [Flavobacterium psychrophilum]AIG29584.1 GCN5 family acetyltransferase [Flavobacterium psychrophilum]AIG31861.1 GCN5 family acetyltransferase [Flavobacterium psychrophilum]AIG34015.1 GCN5 family acetyltransferase [Flavobacterium psychrophilum]AIG36379.1 GCN5 family acetyltransferase [Flavobacterium psychrophilum]AIG38644.1 GCN5 family acetyltransferase [Flavobacterium psychrophilum]